MLGESDSLAEEQLHRFVIGQLLAVSCYQVYYLLTAGVITSSLALYPSRRSTSMHPSTFARFSVLWDEVWNRGVNGGRG